MNTLIRHILIFTDETSNWKVAGLRQLDRLLLAIDDSARERETAIHVYIHSLAGGIKISPAIKSDRMHVHSSRDHFNAKDGSIAAISTRLVPTRDFFAAPFSDAFTRAETPALIISADALASLSLDAIARQLRMVEDSIANGRNGDDRAWHFLRERSDIARAEKRLLRETGKSQDGFIARALNRPFSRALSRWLLRFPLSPNQWTAIFGLIVFAAIMFLIRGDYLGFAIGALLFQLHSALDGCDGEIARVSYRESESGRKLDQIFDRMAGLLFIIGLGIGLSRQVVVSEGMRGFYLLEALGSAVLIGTLESLLTRTPLEEELAASQASHQSFSHYAARNRESFNEGDQLKLWMIKHSGLLGIGSRVTSFVSELTKRDVFNFIFMLIILCGRPSWALHIVAICACTILVLALKSLLIRPAGVKQARVP